jgi:hypothetical protein
VGTSHGAKNGNSSEANPMDIQRSISIKLRGC